jgi:hypothetical protein
MKRLPNPAVTRAATVKMCPAAILRSGVTLTQRPSSGYSPEAKRGIKKQSNSGFSVIVVACASQNKMGRQREWLTGGMDHPPPPVAEVL